MRSGRSPLVRTMCRVDRKRIPPRRRVFHRRPLPLPAKSFSLVIGEARFTRGPDAEPTTRWRPRIESCSRAAKRPNRRGIGRLGIVLDEFVPKAPRPIASHRVDSPDSYVTCVSVYLCLLYPRECLSPP